MTTMLDARDIGSLVEPQIIIPRKFGAYDYDAPQRVLVLRGKEYDLFGTTNQAPQGSLALVWQCGGKTWGGRVAGYVTMPTELRITNGCITRDEILHSGGRLSQRLLDEHAERISEAFDVDLRHALHPRSTMVLPMPNTKKTRKHRA